MKRVLSTLLFGALATQLICCQNDTQTVTIKSPDGTVTTTVTAKKGVDQAALQSSAEIAGSAAAIYLGGRIPVSGK